MKKLIKTKRPMGTRKGSAEYAFPFYCLPFNFAVPIIPLLKSIHVFKRRSFLSKNQPKKNKQKNCILSRHNAMANIVAFLRAFNADRQSISRQLLSIP